MSTLDHFVMPRWMRHALTQLCYVVFTDDIEVLGIVAEVVDSTELFLRSISAPLRHGLVAGTLAFELGAMALPSSRGRRFSQLSRARARAYFGLWYDSNLPGLHDLAKGLKGMITVPYYDHPIVRRQLGYDPDPWIAAVKQQRAERWGDEIRRHKELLVAPRPLQEEAHHEQQC